MDLLSGLDELYAVSDLHLGGPPGHQIFNQGEALAGLIDLLTAQDPDRTVGLVLNGDIVDFLAEEGAAYLSPERAVGMLEHVFADPAFAPVWPALSRFVHTPRRRLVLVLGNHDVELALPRVRERLLAEICGGDEAARGRVRTAMDGAGFPCLVGGARVLCMHGNEVDAWNLVDYDALRKVALAQNRGQSPPAWDPNAGTQLVIDVMNKIKQRHPFVDLLKPETKVVPGVILALDPGAITDLAKLAPVTYRLARGDLKNAGFLSATAPAPGGPPDMAARQRAALELFGGALRGSASEQRLQEEALSMLRQAEDDYRQGLEPLELMSQTSATQTLGLGGFIWDRITGKPPQEALRAALSDWLKDDRTFLFNTEDDTFKQLDQGAGPGVDFLLAGHTHLARALPRQNGAGMYYNSGTWIRLIQLTTAMLADADHFAPVYAALTAGTMKALDDASGLILSRPSVVRLVSGPGGTTGELTRAVLDGGRVTLQPEPGTQHARS